MITGIDVSSYQSETYSLTGVDFVFVKATEGTAYTNPKHAAQVRRARAGGRVVGHYHFLHPGSIQQQAEHFVRRAASRPGDILACDWEATSSGNAGCAEKDQFLHAVKRLRPDHRVILYCSQSWWTTRDTTGYAGDGLWIAQYNGRPGRPDIEAPWVIHQHTDTPLDTNIANFASRTAMAAWAAGTTDQEDDMALSDDDIRHLAGRDGIWPAPADAADYSDDPKDPGHYWSLGTHVAHVTTKVRAMARQLDAIEAKLDQLLAAKER